MMKHVISTGALLLPLVIGSTAAAAAVSLDGVSYTVDSAPGGNATWESDLASGGVAYDDGGAAGSASALMYSTDSYRSEEGFRVSVYFSTSSLGDAGGHQLSFGLVRDDGDLATLDGADPFGNDSSLVSIGVQVTGRTRGLRFSDGNGSTVLDRSGTRTNFIVGQTNKLTLEVARGGHWTYRINDEYEESGIVLDGIDLSERYRFAAHAAGDAASDVIQTVVVENNYAAGERAENVRTTWGINVGALVLDEIADFKTIDFAGVGFNSGASTSADHHAPNKLLETLANGEPENLHVPAWGDLSLDEPQDDPMLASILAVKEAGLQVQGYTNSENLAGDNADTYEVLAERFLNWCDTDPTASAFLDKPYMTGTWDEGRGRYVDTGQFPNRKYMFCYAEYVLKDYGLRYGPYIDSWTFDCGSCITGIGGDVHNSGRIEDQRIFQAFADAVHAGNPDIPLAFNNGRSNGAAAPYSDAVFFDDFMFGHAFGGNGSHAVKGGTFERNRGFIDRIEETDGAVLEGGDYEWDDKIVGNLSSKIGEGAWSYSPIQAWEDDDFLEWNERALTAGGSMSWSGSIPRNGTPVLRDWAYDLYAKLDDHLVATEAPNQPNWTRGTTYLPTATGGERYSRTLREGVDFFHPRGRDVFISLGADAPSWLSIGETRASGSWELVGTPPSLSGSVSFELVASESNGNSSSRTVKLLIESDGGPLVEVLGGGSNTPVTPVTPTPNPTTSRYVTITRRNAAGFSVDGGTGGARGQDVRLWAADSDNVNQQWVETDQGGGYYSYRKMGTELCMDGNNGGERNQNVWLWDCSDDNFNQHWKKVDVGGGYYHFEKRSAPGYVLNGGGGGSNGQSVTLWNGTSTSRNLHWQITEH